MVLDMRPGARRVVLVVEDHRDTRELYETLLTAAGFRCVIAENVDDALHQAKVRPLDVVLLDLGLPDLEHGLRLARQLRELRQALPLIALTGHPKHSLPKGVFRAHVMKPFDPDTLIAAVRQTLT